MPIATAFVAAQAEEAVREDAAPHKGPELLLDEVRRGAFTSSCASEEGLELLADDAVQKRLLR